MEQPKEYTVFISFAKPDMELAEKLKGLFESLRETVYFAPAELRKAAGGEKWRKNIIEGIRKSSAFVPIYTRHSLRRPWVLFESGAAEALRLKRFPARTAGVSIDEIELIGKDVPVFDLFDEEGIVDLAVSVCRAHAPQVAGDRIRNEVEKILRFGPKKDEILKLSKTRWVFIAGNVPTSPGGEEAEASKVKEVRDFVRKLTRSLLKRGFCISSCPQVKDVGAVVSAEYLRWRQRHADTQSYYRIGGLYPVDREIREKRSDLEPEVLDEWKQHLMEFRQSYLADIEWLIIIGGNVGTLEEYEAAKSLRTKIVFIPFYGGTARMLWDKARSKERDPFLSIPFTSDEHPEDVLVDFIEEKRVQ